MKCKNSILSILTFFSTFFCHGQASDTLYLWPDKVPGETEAKHDPVQTENTSGNVIRITDITNPALIVFEPEASINNGTGIIVCPGGGYQILAIDKEGYEIAAWLNSLGFTAFVLHYRVPGKQEGAFSDIQRAIRIIRGSASRWNLSPEKVGVIGFSAGANLGVQLSTRFDEVSYPAINATDTIHCRPAFALLIYPGGLDKGENRSLSPGLTIREDTPPMFIFATADDQYANSALVMATALRDARVPVELHMLAKGGHGYGMRTGNIAGETWPGLAKTWLETVVIE